MGDRLVQKWNYEADEKVDITKLQNRISQLENLISSLQNPYTISSEEFPEGDYMNPILLMEGGLVTIKNKWYYVEDKTRPHRAIVEGFAKAEYFNDHNWFDFV